MLAAALERERRNIYQAGRTEGRVEGQAEGVQVQRQTLLQLVQWRFQPSEQEQRRLAQQIERIHALPQLSDLINVLLQVATLAEFMTHMAEHRSASAS